MEDVGIFYGHLVHFTVFCYILWTYGIVHLNLVCFSVLVFCIKKNLATPGCCEIEARIQPDCVNCLLAMARCNFYSIKF
jgi:hypothetical protein